MPRQFCRSLSQSTCKPFSFFTLPQFPLFFMFHGESNMFANCLSFLPQNTPSAICSIWGSGVGSSDRFNQENSAEVTLWQFPEPGPKILAVPFSVSRNILSGRPTLLCSMSHYSEITMLHMPYVDAPGFSPCRAYSPSYPDHRATYWVKPSWTRQTSLPTSWIPLNDTSQYYVEQKNSPVEFCLHSRLHKVYDVIIWLLF